MLFDTYQNGHKAGSRGFVSSPLQAGNQPQCLSFWFYMASASPVFIRLGALEVTLPALSNKQKLEFNSHTELTTLVSFFFQRNIGRPVRAQRHKHIIERDPRRPLHQNDVHRINDALAFGEPPPREMALGSGFFKNNLFPSDGLGNLTIIYLGLFCRCLWWLC